MVKKRPLSKKPEGAIFLMVTFTFTQLFTLFNMEMYIKTITDNSFIILTEVYFAFGKMCIVIGYITLKHKMNSTCRVRTANNAAYLAL